MGFEYKDVNKDVVVDVHEQLDVVRIWKRFLNKIEELKPYLVKFNKDGIMKNKMYPSNYRVKDENCWPVFIIIHNDYIFFDK